tara:strand:+ start:240 stop:518 length:279 start_codon:yes stop_codon:yes gene_type:complete
MLLTKKECLDKLCLLNKQWQIEDKFLVRTFIFNDFISAFEFLKKIAKISENKMHHPKIYNNFNKVVLKLITHDCDGISLKDFNLATEIDALI